MKVLFVCNKGGHYSQMLELRPLMLKYDSIVLTEKKNAYEDLSGFAEFIYMDNYNVNNHRGVSFVFSMYKCLKIWLKHKPKYIISTGSAFAIPMFLIGKMMGSRLIYIESRARVYKKSKSGNLISKFCDKLIVQWPEMKKIYGDKAEYYGVLA